MSTTLALTLSNYPAEVFHTESLVAIDDLHCCLLCASAPVAQWTERSSNDT